MRDNLQRNQNFWRSVFNLRTRVLKSVIAAQERLDMRNDCNSARIHPVSVRGTKNVWCLSTLMLRLARLVSQFPAQYFGKLPRFNQPLKAYSAFGSFSPVCRPFFKQAREREVKLRHVLYEAWLVSYLFFSFQIWYFRKWMITSIGQSKHMRVTCFDPLWVSVFFFLYINTVYLLLKDANLLLRDSIYKLYIKYSVPPFEGCQTPFQGFHLQVIHKYSVLPSEGCQTPFKGFHWQVIHKYSVLPSEGCQTPFKGFQLQVIHKYSVPPSEGFYLQVIHKLSVPPSEGCQTPFERFHLQVKNKNCLLGDANLPLTDSILAILRFLLPYALNIERFLIFKEQRSLKRFHIYFPCRSKFFIRKLC